MKFRFNRLWLRELYETCSAESAASVRSDCCCCLTSRAGYLLADCCAHAALHTLLSELLWLTVLLLWHTLLSKLLRLAILLRHALLSELLRLTELLWHTLLSELLRLTVLLRHALLCELLRLTVLLLRHSVALLHRHSLLHRHTGHSSHHANTHTGGAKTILLSRCHCLLLSLLQCHSHAIGIIRVKRHIAGRSRSRTTHHVDRSLDLVTHIHALVVLIDVVIMQADTGVGYGPSAVSAHDAHRLLTCLDITIRQRECHLIKILVADTDRAVEIVGIFITRRIVAYGLTCAVRTADLVSALLNVKVTTQSLGIIEYVRICCVDIACTGYHEFSGILIEDKLCITADRLCCVKSSDC